MCTTRAVDHVPLQETPASWRKTGGYSRIELDASAAAKNGCASRASRCATECAMSPAIRSIIIDEPKWPVHARHDRDIAIMSAGHHRHVATWASQGPPAVSPSV
jgi:hypothetical protein